MKKSYLHVFSVLTLAVALLSGCRSEVQLDNIDTTIEAQMQLALPIGSINAKVSDFMGTSESAEFYIDTVDGKNVVTYHRSYEFEKSVTDFDFSTKIGGNKYYVNLYQQIANVMINHPVLGPRKLIQNDSIIVPAGYTYSGKMDFKIPLTLKELNKPNLQQRLDSAQIDEARFTVQLSKHDFKDLDWAWVDTIELDWGENITGIPNRVVVVYKKSDGGSAGDLLPINLLDATLDLMKDHSKAVGSDNVVDSLKLVATVKYTVPGGTAAEIKSGAGLNCDFQVTKIDPRAFWGWFMDEPAYYNQDVNISYSPYNFLNGARLPLANPRIDGTLETPIAGNIRLLVDYLNTTDSAGTIHPATWGESEKLDTVITEGCIDPITSPLSAVAKIKFFFDGTEEHGNIDNMLTEMPRKLSYKIGVSFDKNTTPQIRIFDQVYAKAKATAKVPVDFHKGIKIDYTDTIKGIKLEDASIDSLLAQVNWLDTLKTTNVHVFVKLTNGIPLDIKGTFYCLDKNGNELMDPENPSKRWTIFDGDTVNIAGATYDGAGNVITNTSLFSSAMTREKMDLFPKISQIVYYAYVTDDALKTSTYPEGAKITGSNNVKVALGLTADLDAILNLNNIGKNDKNNNK